MIFDRAPPLHPDVLRQEDLAHAAVAELRDDAIAVGNDRPDEIRRVLGLNQGGAVEEAEHVVCLVARAALRADFFACATKAPQGSLETDVAVAHVGDPVRGSISPSGGRKTVECRLRARRVNLRRRDGSTAFEWRDERLDAGCETRSRTGVSPIRKLSTLEYARPRPRRFARVSTRATLLYAVIVALAVAASATGLANGFALDDVAHRGRQRASTFASRVVAVVRAFRTGRRSTAPRCIARSSLLGVRGAVGSRRRGAVGLSSRRASRCTPSLSALVLALCCSSCSCTRRCVSPRALFAVHPVHVEAVANVVGQSELLAAVAMRSARRSSTSAPATPERSVLGAIASIAAALRDRVFVEGTRAAACPDLLVALEMLRGRGRLGIRPRAAASRNAFARSRRSIVALGVSRAWPTWSFAPSVLGDLLGEKHLGAGLRRTAAVGDAGRRAALGSSARVAGTPVRGLQSTADRRFPSGAGPEIVPGLADSDCDASCTFVALGRGDETRRDQRAGRAARARRGSPSTLLPVSNLFSVMLVAERTLLMPSVGAMLLVGAAAVAGVWPQRRSARGAISAMRACADGAVAASSRSGAVRSRESPARVA